MVDVQPMQVCNAKVSACLVYDLHIHTYLNIGEYILLE